MTSSETSESTEKLVDKAAVWTSSDEGKKEIETAFKQATITSAKYRADQFVDPKSLSEHVTI